MNVFKLRMSQAKLTASSSLMKSGLLCLGGFSISAEKYYRGFLVEETIQSRCYPLTNHEEMGRPARFMATAQVSVTPSDQHVGASAAQFAGIWLGEVVQVSGAGQHIIFL